MLTYKDILTSITKTLRYKFGIDVFTSTINQGFNKECFYVSLIGSPSERVGRNLTQTNLTISIKYFGDGDTIKLYEMIDRLNRLFSKEIKIKDRVITLSKNEPNIVTDEIGEFLDFLIPISFIDTLYKTEEEIKREETTELMQEININKEVIR